MEARALAKSEAARIRAAEMAAATTGATGGSASAGSGDGSGGGSAAAAEAPAPPAAAAVVAADGNSGNSGKSCVTCGGCFPTAGEHRAHFKSDWHRYNLKLKLANQPTVTEAEFAIDADGFF